GPAGAGAPGGRLVARAGRVRPRPAGVPPHRRAAHRRAVRPAPGAVRARRGRPGGRAGRLRAVVPELLHLDRHARDLPGGPVRPAGVPGHRAGPPAARRAGPALPGPGIPPAAVVGARLEPRDRLLPVDRRAADGRVDRLPTVRPGPARPGPPAPPPSAAVTLALTPPTPRARRHPTCPTRRANMRRRSTRTTTSWSSGCRPTARTCPCCVPPPPAWPPGWISRWTRSRTCASRW